MSNTGTKIFCDGPVPLKFYLLVGEKDLQERIQRNGGLVVSNIEDSTAIIIPSLFSSDGVEKLLPKRLDRAVIFAQWVHECDQQRRRIGFQAFEYVIRANAFPPPDNMAQRPEPAPIIPEARQASVQPIARRRTRAARPFTPRHRYTEEEDAAMVEHLSHGPPNTRPLFETWIPFGQKYHRRSALSYYGRHLRCHATFEKRAEMLRRERAAVAADVQMFQHLLSERLDQPGSSGGSTVNHAQHSMGQVKVENGQRCATASVTSEGHIGETEYPNDGGGDTPSVSERASDPEYIDLVLDQDSDSE